MKRNRDSENLREGPTSPATGLLGSRAGTTSFVRFQVIFLGKTL